VLSLPPFANVARRLAAVLLRQRQPLLAATLLTSVAKVLAHRGDLATAGELRRRAVPALCRLGHRRQAWREAWTSGSVLALLRCCWPG